MEQKISELLSGLEIEDLAPEEERVVSAVKIKEITMRKIEASKTKRTPRAGKRILALALAAALLLALGVTAYATGWFGLQNSTISDTTLAGSFSDGKYIGEAIVPAKVITLAGYAGTREYQAAQEWRAFYNEYVASGYNGDAFGQDLGEWGEQRHVAYGELYTPALCEKFREISEKYGLLTRTGRYDSPSFDNYAELCRCAGIGQFLDGTGRDPSTGSYTLYDDGSFRCSDVWWPDGEPGDNDRMLFAIWICRNVKGSMDTDYVAFGAEEQLEEWSYTTAGGDQVDIVLGQDAALILSEGEGAYVTVLVGQLQVLQGKGLVVDREMLERYADTVSFAALGSRGQVDFPGSGSAYAIPTPEPEG